MKTEVTYPENAENPIECKIEFDQKDSWDMAMPLCAIIHYSVLEFFKHSKEGTPHVDNADVPENLRVDEMYCPEKWQWVLNEIVWATGQRSCVVKDEEPFDFGSPDWYDRSSAYHKRVQNGLILFGKYVNAMWT